MSEGVVMSASGARRSTRTARITGLTGLLCAAWASLDAFRENDNFWDGTAW